jgi:hypothetical protein
MMPSLMTRQRGQLNAERQGYRGLLEAVKSDVVTGEFAHRGGRVKGHPFRRAVLMSRVGWHAA